MPDEDLRPFARTLREESHPHELGGGVADRPGRIVQLRFLTPTQTVGVGNDTGKIRDTGGEVDTLRKLWRTLTTTRYTRLLEEEVARLRAENRAMMNSLLGTAGIPPVDFPAPQVKEIPRLRRRSWPQIQACLGRQAQREAEATQASHRGTETQSQ